jgi:carbonic anhydrase/acetyltransferase-like protein (isoleucine patch superfamily)
MIDPSAFIARGAIVLGDVRLGPNSSVWYNSVIRGDTERIEVGEGSNIQDLSMLHADPGFPCRVGCRVSVGHRAILHGCTVEDDCLIGMGAILLNGARIGRGCLVGAGALVTEGKAFDDHSLIMGSPAKAVRMLDKEAVAKLRQSALHYVDNWRRFALGMKAIDPGA